MTSACIALLLLVSCAASLDGAGSGSVAFLSGGWRRIQGPVSTLADKPLETATVAPTMSLLVDASPLPFATVSYVIRLPVDQTKRQYSLYLPGIADFESVQVDGKTVSMEGLGADPELFVTPSASYVTIALESGPGGPRLEDPGLVPRLILFGESRSIHAFRLVSTGISVLQSGYFFLSGLFLFILFLFWRKNRDFLALAGVMAAAGLFTIAKTGGFFGLLAASRAAASFFTVASASLFFASIAVFLADVFRGALPKAVFRVFTWIPVGIAAASASIFFLPAAEMPLYVAASAWCAILFLASVIFLAVKAAQRSHRAWWLLPPMVVAGLSIGLHRLFPSSLVAAIFLESAGITVLAFVAMLMLVRKVGDTFETSEALTTYVNSVTSTMKRFIPSEFLNCLDKRDVIDLKLGDHVRKEMTIFFSDIRSFTELSEKLTVEENFAFINSYLSRVVPIVSENGGFVDKYIGDGIMALFEGENGADAAIRAAIAMQEKIVEYNGHRAKMGYRAIGMGVGIHTGDLMLGVIGVDNRMENTVISDSVNLASRLQAITKAFNISLAISEQAFKELEDPGVYKYRFIGKVKVKGKAAPVSVFEIFDGIAADVFERKMKANTYFEQGMLSYYQKDFGGAMYYFKRVLEILPEDGAASFYLENCINKANI